MLLPDGREFKTWEPAGTLEFARTYSVDQAHPKASDENPGSNELPFRTIGRAARVLEPGQRVVIAAGTYRERVRPARGGTGPERMIGYEAAPGAKVVLSGSQLLTARWEPSRREGKAGGAGVWMAGLPKQLFPEENPFAQVNLTDRQIDASMDWAIPTKSKPPNTLCRGLVFENGRRLKQVAGYEDLARTKGSYWVEPGGQRLHAAPLGPAEPGRSRFEVTVRGYVFAPEQFGLGYVRVKGLAIEHSASCFPRPQEGALSTRRGHHWIIEDNVVRQCNAIGIDVGDQFDTAGPDLAQGGQHVVRRNVVSDCGIGGIEGPRIRKTLIEDNVLARCGWQQAERIYETGGIKVHCTVDCVLRRNLVTDTIDAPGIWMDYTNVNSRCTQNVILDCRSSFGGIFMEASQVPNLVDHNFIWGTAGNGVYQHDCDELVVAHNFIGRSTGAGVRMQICQGRMVGGRLSTAKRNKIAGNVLVDNGSMLAISDPDNVSDGNLFSAGRTPFDLEAWRKAHGWDRNSAAADVEATFDRRTMALTWRVAGQIPPVARMDPIAYDLLGQPRTGKTVLPGPLVSVPSSPARVPFGPHLPALRLVWQ